MNRIINITFGMINLFLTYLNYTKNNIHFEIQLYDFASYPPDLPCLVEAETMQHPKSLEQQALKHSV